MDEERRCAKRLRGAALALRGAPWALFSWQMFLLNSAWAQQEAPADQSDVGKPPAGEDAASGVGDADADDPSEGSDDDEQAASAEDIPPDDAKKNEAAAGEDAGELGDEDELSDDRPSTDSATASSEPPARAPKHIEDEDDWVSWPFSSDSEEGQRQRWAGVGAFVGWVSRPSDSDSIKYRPGIAYGGYLRPEITSWLGLRMFYREENIPVSIEPGAFDFEESTFDFDFTQPDLTIVNLGARLEPTWTIHPRFRLRAVVGWSWLRMRAAAPKAEGFEIKKTFRAAVQTEITLGGGLSFDVVQDWLDVGVDIAHGFPNSRGGDAYEDQQVIVDGQIRHIAPLPRLERATDIIFHAGLIL